MKVPAFLAGMIVAVFLVAAWGNHAGLGLGIVLALMIGTALISQMLYLLWVIVQTLQEKARRRLQPDAATEAAEAQKPPLRRIGVPNGQPRNAGS